ncbi:molybdopterin-dependent oxidoreductase (plasmid) [Streptomyces sp. NBC_00984]|uniref:molybdopterin-dependent oxidoreductase n=1 Tax=Streptomyces sp. NBC_00984 TaxID=2903700 RepID=UPI002F919772|nr:molybdopterin-dependent oxidoreductase [Streptomyces sp. NBC_00984]
MSLDELRYRFPERKVLATLQCAGNRRADLMEFRDIPGQVPWGPGAISTAWWTGVSLADVLAEAALQAEAAHIAFTGTDVSQDADPSQPFGASIPAAKAASSEVLLAWAMNDQALPVAHGAPLRAIVPGFIGARSVKWLQHITAQTRPTTTSSGNAAFSLPRPTPTRPDQATASPSGRSSFTSPSCGPAKTPSYRPDLPRSPAWPSPATTAR